MREWLLGCFKSPAINYDIPEDCYKKLLVIAIFLAAVVKFYVALRDYFLNFSCLFPNDFLFFLLLGISYIFVKKDKLETAVNIFVLAVLFTLTYCLLAGHYSSLFWFPLIPLMAGIFFNFRKLLIYAYIPIVTNTLIFLLKFPHLPEIKTLTSNSPIVLGFEAFVAYITFVIAITIYRMFIDAYRNGLKKLLEVDVLTTALTRRALFSQLDKIKERGIPYSLIMFDIDHFKSVNDTFGHQTGDRILKEVSVLVRKNLRKGDIIGRYGGEEFLIALPGAKKSEATIVAEKIRRLIEQNDFSIPKKITVSLGVADSVEAEDVEKLIKLVDDRLYTAKKMGRNRVINM
ncbi:diguanylate cyclase (GGDEF) domain-containing protein [Desulfurobacterium pacificum]|uniref:diguanylate cyclase n=1 Tax=Desulfurobacterium pacificum TaxID=240166 RepID=A0ABY1NI48_9BACT|nr:GGDEF domain-containing protein [Desulfurobacterium pacificum]SMP10327.1 diguanylate cyclase (GGDEF) domain-containing protein [Desulfurobacterium pacificum]